MGFGWEKGESVMLKVLDKHKAGNTFLVEESE